MLADIAYQDQKDAAIAETSDLMRKIAISESYNYSIHVESNEWPSLLKKSIDRLYEKTPEICQHMRDTGPQPYVIYMSHSMYAYCVPCATTGDALKIRQMEQRCIENCYYCSRKTKTFQEFAFQYRNILFIGDVCFSCAKEAGIFRRE
jgi:hypothetical protein